MNRFPLQVVQILFAVVSLALATGCKSYITPAGRADLRNINSATMAQSFAAKPAAQLPASIAAVRVQSSGYRNYNTEREGGVYGQGKFSVVTVKEVESDEDIQRLSKLPNVGGIISISRLLLPERLQSDGDLREAAARLKADMLLIYTFDTAFYDNNLSVPLRTITLGLSPTRKISATVTASALLMDTRTGFIYGAFETTEKRNLITNSWESRESADRARRNAESAAFKALVGEFERAWPAIVERANKGA